MFGLSRALQAWVHAEPTDMRESFNTLSALVTEEGGREVLSGGLFVFISRERPKVQNQDGPRDQAELPRLEQMETLDRADEMRAKCGAERQEFAGPFEEADDVDIVERRFVLVKDKRQEYRCACGCNETASRRMGEKAVTNTKRWQVWALGAPDSVLYHLQPSRGAEAAEQLLQDFSGAVMCDGYSAYQSLETRRHDFNLAHYWAHARRKFVEIEESFPRQSDEALALNTCRSRRATDSSMGA